MILKIILSVVIVFVAFAIPFWIDGRGPNNVPKNLSNYVSKTLIVTWVLSMGLMVLALLSVWS